MYEQLAERIDQLHPDLLQEVETEDLPPDREKYYTLGSFIEVREEDRRHGEWNQYYIWMRLDHVDSHNTDKRSAALAHEYGHFLCRTVLYPRLGKIGRFILHKIQSRQPFKLSKDFTINFIILVEELTAWVLGWGMLLKLGGLKKNQIQYGFKCWKSYWYRMRRLCRR